MGVQIEIGKVSIKPHSLELTSSQLMSSPIQISFLPSSPLTHFSKIPLRVGSSDVRCRQMQFRSDAVSKITFSRLRHPTHHVACFSSK
ncbi:hypothetical protein TSUD_201430 [Trifolium subterraneum]|uniref:Uncharacterized protein n=1 Tax=Trifolium subterraneum TaxID=3900 RepID=A0A2Z6LQ87_TRISU|nr:hypothetical protein TSUD_201430 [Trifolium subterraneum]